MLNERVSDGSPDPFPMPSRYWETVVEYSSEPGPQLCPSYWVGWARGLTMPSLVLIWYGKGSQVGSCCKGPQRARVIPLAVHLGWRQYGA